MTNMNKTLDIIVPMLNEHECLDEFLNRVDKLRLTLENKDVTLKVLIVDDGSEYSFKNLLKEKQSEISFLEVLTLTRNFGHQAAIRAGIDSSVADGVVMIDGDLQDPPELISEMVDFWLKGADHVAAIRKSRQKESIIKKKTASAFYKLIDKSTGFKSTKNSGDFKLITRWIVEEIKSINEHNLFIRGFVDWLGGDKKEVFYDRDPRFAGEKKYKYSQSLKVALNGLVGVSDFFPKFLNKVFVSSIVGVIFLVAWIFVSLVYYPENLVPGWSSLILTLMVILVLQTFSFIFITFYIKKIFDQTSGKKNYSVMR